MYEYTYKQTSPPPQKKKKKKKKEKKTHRFKTQALKKKSEHCISYK